MVICQQQGDEIIITLEPNRSATRKQNLQLLLLVTVTTFSVALFWAFYGAWLVLPFAGLEIAVLTYVMFRVLRLTQRMQVIRVSPDSIQVEEGETFPVRRWHFSRPDAHLNVQPARSPMDSIQLQLDDGNQSLELGGFLNQDDRIRTQEALLQSGLMICNDRWWAP